MNCPQCNNPMKEGFIHIGGSGGTLLNWSKNAPKYLFEKGKKKLEEFKTIMKHDVLFGRKKENWLRKASYCEKCDLYSFVNKWEE